ncbi:MAG: hypothetical protein EAZ95_13300 [Bacteroidetes bacterium]|nr:MAG: hypothetical protein EAZ95_13300 [Bacteroidota bacterium]
MRVLVFAFQKVFFRQVECLEVLPKLKGKVFTNFNFKNKPLPLPALPNSQNCPIFVRLIT